MCLLWFHEARGQRFSCAGAVRPKRLVYPRKYMRRDRNGWVAQVRQKFWLRAVLFLFVVTQSETLIHEQPEGMCVLEDSKLHHRFDCHVAGRLLHDCVVSTRATPSVLTHLDPKSDLTIRFLSRRSRCSFMLVYQYTVILVYRCTDIQV